MDYSKLSASDGTGEAVVANIESPRSIGATTLDVDSVDNWPANFIFVTGTLNPNGYISNSSMTIMYGHLDSGNIVIDSYAPGYTDVGNTAGQIAVIKPTTEWVDKIVALAKVAHNNDGTIKSSAVEGVAPGNWKSGLPAINTITNNGVHSIDLVFASSVAATLSPGDRLRTQRTVTAPTYMASLNGSNQYFTKTSPTGTLSTVANNFTIIADILPTDNSIGMICGRTDSTPNNGFFFRREANGQITVACYNGAGNFRQQSTYRSTYFKRKHQVAVSWASGTVTIYIDGRSVPLKSQVTSGTAPTTAGTGGDWSIGRSGSFNSQYFKGNIASVAVFDAVLTEATIRNYMNQPVLGSETNCIGAWDLNNRATDQNAAANNLTAQNSAGYTSGLSLHATNANGVATGDYDFGIIQSVSGTNVTVQMAEGCSIPTTGGIAGVAYSQSKSPYNFPSSEDRFELNVHFRENLGTTATAGTVTGTFHGHKLPIGKWKARYDLDLGANAGAAQALGGTSSLSTSASAHTPIAPSLQDFGYIASNTDDHRKHTKEDTITMTAMTDLYLAVSPYTTCSSFSAQWGLSPGGIKYVNAWL